MIELTELELEFLKRFEQLRKINLFTPKDSWVYPNNNGSNDFNVAESLLNKGLLMRVSVPIKNNNSFCGLKHYYSQLINND